MVCFLSGSKGNVSDMGRSMERKGEEEAFQTGRGEREELTDDYGQLWIEWMGSRIDRTGNRGGKRRKEGKEKKEIYKMTHFFFFGF